MLEIDITGESRKKFKVYAAFGVPEIWHYDGVKARIYELMDKEYQKITASVAFPILTAEALTFFLEQSKTQRQSITVAAFRRWLRERLSA